MEEKIQKVQAIDPALKMQILRQKKNVFAAYHQYCEKCRIKKNVCAKCLTPRAKGQLTPDEQRDEDDKKELEILEQMETMREREKRTFIRRLNEKEDSDDGEEGDDGEDEDDDDESDDDDEESDGDEDNAQENIFTSSVVRLKTDEVLRSVKGEVVMKEGSSTTTD